MIEAQDALCRLRAVTVALSHRKPADAIFLSEMALGLPVLERGTVHEFFAAERQDAPAAAGFAACVASRHGKENLALLWVRHVDKRAGTLYGHGLAGLGVDPGSVIHLPVADEKDALRAGLEGVRSSGLACVIIEIAGKARLLDLTATRRLNLAAAESGVSALIVRSGTTPGPSAAQTRWQVTTSLSASPGLELPGKPSFTVTLLKHRAAEAGGTWDLEWDHETKQFAPKTLSRPVVAVPFDRTHQAGRKGIRTHAG